MPRILKTGQVRFVRPLVTHPQPCPGLLASDGMGDRLGPATTVVERGSNGSGWK